MTKQQIINKITFFTEQSESNFIAKEKALSPGVAGMKIFDIPVIAFGSAVDEMFLELIS